MEDGDDLVELQDKISLYFGGDTGEGDGEANNMSMSGDDIVLNKSGGDMVTASGEVDMFSEDEIMSSDVLMAVSRFKDTTTSRDQKRNRRGFKIPIGGNSTGGNINEEISLSPPQNILSSPISKSPSTSTTTLLSNWTPPPPSRSPPPTLLSPSSGLKVPLYQTSPYKSSALSPNTTRVDDSSPQTIGKYQLLHHIGQGYFGNTYTGVPPDSSEYVSIKIFDKQRLNLFTQNILMNDFQLLKNLKSPNQGIVNYLNIINDTTTTTTLSTSSSSSISSTMGSATVSNGIGIVQEFIENGSLSDSFKRTGVFSELLLGKYIAQILETLSWVHSQGIIHRNLKASNVLLGKGGKCKLSDFSIGCTISSPDPSLMYSLLAQPYWMAPEILQMRTSFNTKVDSWGVGCIILECLTGHPPYAMEHSEPMKALIEIINLNHSMDSTYKTLGISQQLVSFLDACFKKDPLERASVQDLLKHPWLQSSQETSTAPISLNPNRRSDIPINIDLLAISEQTERDISEISINPPSMIDFKRFDFQHYSSLGEVTIDSLKQMIDHNQTIANNLKYQIQDSYQEQQKLTEMCQNMKHKIQEILDQNKTGARMSAHSNMLLKRTNQMASELVKKNENLHHNIRRLEDYFINKDDCGKKLANVVYRHKTSFESLTNPTLAANVLYQLNSKSWKKGQEKKALATLKDNFLFFFKNEKSSVPLDVVYINDRKNFTTTTVQLDSKKKLYILLIGTTINSDQSNDSVTDDDSQLQQLTSLDDVNNNNLNNMNSGSSSSSNPDSVIWCIMGFDNQKNVDNWLNVLESSIPWYDKKLNEISNKPIVFEKKHKKERSFDNGSVATKHSKTLSNDDSVSSSSPSTSLTKFPGIFGIRIEDLLLRENVGVEIPYFLTRMLKFLELHLDEEGILRMSGSSTEIQEIKTSLQKGDSIDYSVKDPHAVTGVLKLFLRELPEPVIASDLLRSLASDIITSSGGIGNRPIQEKFKEVSGLLASMSKPSYHLLKHMIQYARRVIDHSDQNKMVMANVTTCFTPSLRIPPAIFSLLIQHYDHFFSRQ